MRTSRDCEEPPLTVVPVPPVAAGVALAAPPVVAPTVLARAPILSLPEGLAAQLGRVVVLPAVAEAPGPEGAVPFRTPAGPVLLRLAEPPAPGLPLTLTFRPEAPGLATLLASPAGPATLGAVAGRPAPPAVGAPPMPATPAPPPSLGAVTPPDVPRAGPALPPVTAPPPAAPLPAALAGLVTRLLPLGEGGASMTDPADLPDAGAGGRPALVAAPEPVARARPVSLLDVRPPPPRIDQATGPGPAPEVEIDLRPVAAPESGDNAPRVAAPAPSPRQGSAVGTPPLAARPAPPPAAGSSPPLESATSPPPALRAAVPTLEPPTGAATAALVVGTSDEGLPVLRLPDGRLAALETQALPTGTALSLGPAPSALPPAALADPARALALALLDLAGADPGAARLLARLLPRPGPAAGPGLMVAAAAIEAAEALPWLAAPIERLRAQGRAAAAERLVEAAEGGAESVRETDGDGAPQAWTVALVPFLVDGRVERVRLGWSRPEGDAGTPDRAARRFVVEIAPSRLGALQLEGIVARAAGGTITCDLILRGRSPDAELVAGARSAWARGLAAAGVSGGFSVQAGGAGWRRLGPPLDPDRLETRA